MTLTHSFKRILVVGREVGPITQLLKEKIPKVSIGVIDVLGNEETRFFSDWAFSVEKQTPDRSILRFKHHTLLDLLYELTLVMLEDLEFDLFIPLSPFQTKPQYLHKLSQEVEIISPNIEILEYVRSAYTFLTQVSATFPEIVPKPIQISDLDKNPSMTYPVVFVSEGGTVFFSSEKFISSEVLSNQSGFLLPISQIHCAFFLSFPLYQTFIGLQTLSSPIGHSFFPHELEKNTLLPFSLPQGFTLQRIVSFLKRIITNLGFTGMITVYFGLSEDKIHPISCNVLPDENFDLWECRSSKSLIPFLFSSSVEKKTLFPSSKYVFKSHVYSYQSIRVPSLPKDLCIQRNLARVISHPEYPLCAIFSSSSSPSSIYHLFNEKKKKLLKILHSIV